MQELFSCIFVLIWEKKYDFTVRYEIINMNKLYIKNNNLTNDLAYIIYDVMPKLCKCDPRMLLHSIYKGTPYLPSLNMNQ